MGGCKEEYKQQATGVCRNHLNKIFIVQKENSFFNGGTRYWEQGKTSSRVDGRGKISWRIYTERTHTQLRPRLSPGNKKCLRVQALIMVYKLVLQQAGGGGRLNGKSPKQCSF